MRFTEWLKNRDLALFESIARHLRPELDTKLANRLAILEGDLVDLGPETKLKGKRIPRIGRVSKVRMDSVVVQDLTRNDGTLVIIPIDELYNKEDLMGRILTPGDERDLKMLGGKNIWIRLTPRQYKKFKSKYKPPEMPQIVMSQDDAEPSKKLKKMFSQKSSDPVSPDPLRGMFAPESKPERPSIIQKPSPLQRFVRRDS